MPQPGVRIRGIGSGPSIRTAGASGPRGSRSTRVRMTGAVFGVLEFRGRDAPTFDGTQAGAGPHRDAGCILVADARLDDRDSLCDALGVPHPERPAAGDHSLILRAWRRWGPECPNHLLGDYAFALWDADTRTLFCARDHIGCRPFYYAQTPERFIFASTVEAVLAAPGVSDALDEPMVASYLTQLFVCTATRTFFKAVRKLPSGHSLTVETAPSPRAPRLQRWWRPERTPKAPPAGDDETAARFLDLYARAVKDRLRGGPVGVHLSGGLDSSSIAVLAARELRRQGRPPPPAFTWLRPLGGEPPGAAYAPEYARVEETAAREGLRVHHCHNARPEDYVSAFRRDLTCPLVPTPYEEEVRSRAAELGLRVLLSGLGGDECVSFNGRGYYADLLLRGRWRRLAAECRARGKAPAPFLARTVLMLVHPDLFWRLYRWRRDGRRGRYYGGGGRWLIHPAFARRVRPLPDRSTVREIGVRRTQLRLLQDWSLSSAMEEQAASGARHGIEYRYPLLDRRLLEFALGLPPEQFRRGGWGRWLMRYALAPVLPPDVLWSEDKADPARSEPMVDAIAGALPAVRREVAARAGTLARARYVDVPRLLERLDPERFRARPRTAPIIKALHVLDF